MATYGKPTTEFYVNYGSLDPAAAQRALAPVIIAPRYDIVTSSLGMYGDEADKLVLDAWDNGKGTVDTESVVVYAKNAKVVTYTDLAFVRDEKVGNKLSISDSALSLNTKPGIMLGDIIKFGSTSVEVIRITATDGGFDILVDASLDTVTDLVGSVVSGRGVESSGMLKVDGTTVSGDTIVLPSVVRIGDNELAYGELYVEYRTLLKNENGLELRTNISKDSLAWAGICDSRNPMGMMFTAASQAADGAFFYLLAIDNESEDSYRKAIEYVGQFEDCYSIISYRQTEAIQKAIIAVIEKYSNPQIARFKRTWLCETEDMDLSVYSKLDDGSALTVVGLDDGVISITAGADLYKGRVMPGDIAQIGDRKFIVKEVDSKSSLVLEDYDNSELIGLVVKFERPSARADKLAEKAAGFNSARVNFVVADGLEFAGEVVSPIYACAALASQRCALPPHAPMNDMVLPGFTVKGDLGWTDAQYEKLNNSGCWVLYRDIDGRTLTYHQITTLTNGTIAEEDSCVSNADAIVRTLRQSVAYLCGGKGNATEQLLGDIRTELISAFVTLSSEVHPALYGPRIIDWNITNLYIPEGNSRSVVCSCDIDTPQPTQDSVFTFNLF